MLYFWPHVDKWYSRFMLSPSSVACKCFTCALQLWIRKLLNYSQRCPIMSNYKLLCSILNHICPLCPIMSNFKLLSKMFNYVHYESDLFQFKITLFQLCPPFPNSLFLELGHELILFFSHFFLCGMNNCFLDGISRKCVF